MSAGIENLCANDIAMFTERLADLSQRIAPNAQPRKDNFYRELDAAWRDSCRACREIEAQLEGEPEEIKEAKESFRQQIRPWLDQSWYLAPGTGEAARLSRRLRHVGRHLRQCSEKPRIAAATSTFMVSI